MSAPNRRARILQRPQAWPGLLAFEVVLATMVPTDRRDPTLTSTDSARRIVAGHWRGGCCLDPSGDTQTGAWGPDHSSRPEPLRFCPSGSQAARASSSGSIHQGSGKVSAQALRDTAGEASQVGRPNEWGDLVA
jgi:hypothetical protein